MPQFGTKSKAQLATIDPQLQDVLNDAIEHFDFTIVHGHRDQVQQDKAFAAGFSRNPWPTSKHNTTPSTAVDIVPYPELYKADYIYFYEMASYVLSAASSRGIKLRWGGHWINYTGKGRFDRDWAHFEIIT
jgi:hypothetical protein